MLFVPLPKPVQWTSGLAKAGRAVHRLLLALGLLLLPGGLSGQDVGVFLRIVDAEPGTMVQVSSDLEGAIESAGWNLLVSYEAGVEAEACSFGARVFVVDWPEHTRVVLSQGYHGAFAAPLRLAVYEDELGVHVSAVNPRSVNRTIVAEEGMDEEWARFADALRETISSAMGRTPAQGEFGQFRDKGRIGRTLGIMAGGPFLEKIKDVTTVPAGEDGPEGVARRVFDALQAREPGKDWGMRPVYLMTPAENVAVVGFTGERMEARSFSIVGKGSDDGRSEMACPGIDHAAAYPVEVVFVREGEEVRVVLVDEMYRMKMFFEDAGKMSFARNMTMPGSIEDEIKNLVRSALF
jgi:hypothetical protein